MKLRILNLRFVVKIKAVQKPENKTKQNPEEEKKLLTEQVAKLKAELATRAPEAWRALVSFFFVFSSAVWGFLGDIRAV